MLTCVKNHRIMVHAATINAFSIEFVGDTKMARHQVKSFEVCIAPSGKSVQVEIETELKKPYKFTLTPDVHYPTVQNIEEKLTAALAHCVDTYEKVDVSVFKDRSYVSINVKDFIDTRFSGNAA